MKDIYPGNNDFDNNYKQNCIFGTFTITVTPYNIFFLGDDGVHGLELWSFVDSPHPPVGLKTEAVTKQETRLFPNPASQKITLTSNKEILQIKIVNALGNIVKEINSNVLGNSIEIYVGDFPEGIYLVRINTAGGVQTNKFIKE